MVDPVPFTWSILEMSENRINLTWSQESSVGPGDSAQIFSLTISHGSSSQVISLNGSYYYFTAPEGAPPCEVYNFSVTATYVGATYTGAGCSVPSPVLSRMLPSLPDVERLESSLTYHLVQQAGVFTLNVTFEVSCHILICCTISYVHWFQLIILLYALLYSQPVIVNSTQYPIIHWKLSDNFIRQLRNRLF